MKREPIQIFVVGRTLLYLRPLVQFDLFTSLIRSLKVSTQTPTSLSPPKGVGTILDLNLRVSSRGRGTTGSGKNLQYPLPLSERSVCVLTRLPSREDRCHHVPGTWTGVPGGTPADVGKTTRTTPPRTRDPREVDVYLQRRSLPETPERFRGGYGASDVVYQTDLPPPPSLIPSPMPNRVENPEC